MHTVEDGQTMKVIFILVEPKVPENIGASARAMNTMGFSELRLVNPENHLQEKALRLAHASHEVLEKAKTYESLGQAIEDIDFVIATSAKERRVSTRVYPVNSLKQVLLSKQGTVHSAGIVFGREESGLTNEEADLCDIISYVPMYKSYPSLNLSQAVMVYAHHLFLNDVGEIAAINTREEASYCELKSKAEAVLEELGVKRNPALYGRLMERLAELGDKDIHLLHSLIKFYVKRKS
jgi:tRNA/rRNA methyltransferase